MSERTYLTIGEVVDRLKSAYPDLSISKIRFLEEEGLVTPDRTAGGYRKFSASDIGRIELVLRLQKEHFLPLAVIRERLADYDRGKMPAELKSAAMESEAAAVLVPEDTGPVLLEDAQSSLGIPVSFVRELVEFGLLATVRVEGGEAVERDDVAILHAAWDLRRFGVEPRHLRMYETFAEREASFFSQILMPAFRHRTPETRQKLVETLNELAGLTGDLKGHLLRRSLRRTFDDLG